MEEKSKCLYVKRTQRDYPMSFKLAVVREVESGEITNNGAMRKYSIQGHAWSRCGIFFSKKRVQKFCRLRNCVYFCTALCLKWEII